MDACVTCNRSLRRLRRHILSQRFFESRRDFVEHIMQDLQPPREDCGSPSEPGNIEQSISEQGTSEPGTSEQVTRSQDTNTKKQVRKEKPANKRTDQESEYDAENQMIEEALEIMRKQTDSNSNDPYVAFAMHVAAELRKYDATMFTRVKHSINTIIYEADMERLNQLSTQEYNAENRRGYFTTQFTNLDSSSSSNMDTGLTQLIHDLDTDVD